MGRIYSQSLNPDRPNNPSFSVHKNGTDQTSIGAAAVKVTWPTEEFDTNSDFASNIFTPTIAGKYYLSSILTFDPTSNLITVAAIYKNGSLYKRERVNAGASAVPNSVSVNCVVDANGSTDYFEIYTSNVGGTITLLGDVTDTFFTGCKID